MGKLIILGTTIGNIEDVSIRSLRTIFEAQIVYSEDTRVFKKFKSIISERYSSVLAQLEIQINENQLNFSYRDQNHDRVISQILESLKDNDIVLTSDAGMPGISDPGYKLIEAAIADGFEIDVIPGPTAVSTAVVLSGLPSDYYSFVGFLPRKKSRIKKLLDNYNLEQTSVVFFESPFRIVKTLEALVEVHGEDLKVAACGEMTKKFQRVERGSVLEVIQKFKNQGPKGEWVCVVRF